MNKYNLHNVKYKVTNNTLMITQTLPKVSNTKISRAQLTSPSVGITATVRGRLTQGKAFEIEYGHIGRTHRATGVGSPDVYTYIVLVRTRAR